MSWFEAEYLITTRTDSITDMMALFASVQFAVFAVIYFLRDVHDRTVRHAVMFLYSLVSTFSLAKTIADFIVLGYYTRLLAEIIKRERDSELLLGSYAGYSFMATAVIVYVSLWAATLYFLYFHKFSNHLEAKI